jgi:steroid 5-alpha reductase family enzyme
MALSQLYLISGLLIFGLITALWLLSLLIKNSSIVDIFWGIGFVIINLIAFYFSQKTSQQILLTILGTFWGLRLSIHIFLRNKTKPEDFRYAQWRKENGSKWWWVSLFKVFALQGVLQWIIAIPLLTVQATGFGVIRVIQIILAMQFNGGDFLSLRWLRGTYGRSSLHFL